MNRTITFVLVFLAALLAGLLAWLWVDPHGSLRGVHWQAPTAVRPDLGNLSAASLQGGDADVSRFMAILDRPVFSPTRRPPPPPPPPKVVVAPRPDPLDTIHLYGLFSGAGGGGLIARIDGKTRRVRVSETIGDWTLKEIRARDVVFGKGAETRVVPLVPARQAAGGAPPRPAFAAPVGPPAAPAAPGAAVPPSAPSPGASAVPPGAAAPSNPFVIGGSR